MRRLIRVGVIPLLKDISENHRLGTVRAILVPMSAARFDLIRPTRVEMRA
jgi:hypothetical protein